MQKPSQCYTLITDHSHELRLQHSVFSYTTISINLGRARDLLLVEQGLKHFVGCGHAQKEKFARRVVPWVPEVFLAMFGHERRSREKKPVAQRALIYCAKWTLTSSLICQSNRQFHTVITCTSSNSGPVHTKTIVNANASKRIFLSPFTRKRSSFT